jgi:hypothetical protein
MKELPSDTLANGAEGIKDLITNFDDAYVEIAIYVTEIHLSYPVAASRISRMSVCRRNYTTRTLRKDGQ